MTGIDSDTIQQSYIELFPESGVNMKTAFIIQFVTDRDRVKQFADYIPFKKSYWWLVNKNFSSDKAVGTVNTWPRDEWNKQ